MNKVELASAVTRALANDHVVDRAETQDIINQASQNGISYDEIVAARELLTSASQELALAQQGYQDADAAFQDALDRLNPIDAGKAAIDRQRASVAVKDAQGRQAAYAGLAETFYRNASPTTRAAADLNTNVQRGADSISDRLHRIFD